MKAFVAAGKFAIGLAHAVSGLFTILFEFPRLTPLEREDRVQAWAAKMLRIIGIRVEVSGEEPSAGPVLLVANHISWLDILVMHAAKHCRFVSKADVKRWPLVGTLATGAGTLYIERESRRDALRVVHHMAERLRGGDVLAIFPEGTTSDGVGLLPFHGNLLQAAISAEAPAQPVALSFVDASTGELSRAPSYVGDDTLVASIWRTLTAPPIIARVVFGAPQHANERGRRQWAHDLREAVANARISTRG